MANKEPKTLVEWGEKYLRYCNKRRHMTPATLEGKKYLVRGFVRRMYEIGIERPEQLTNDIIDEWIDWLEGEPNFNKNNTINTKIAHVKVFLEYIRDMDGDIHLKFILIVRRPVDPIFRKAFTREQVNKALCLADRQDWLMIKLCFDDALRISELRNLELKNIDFARNKIDFIGKGRKASTVYFSDEVKARLEDWIERTKPEKYLWEGMASLQGVHRPMSISQIRKRMKRCFEAAGLQGFHPHALRYSCATEMSNMNAPTRKIQRALRHSNVAVTEDYLCNYDEETRETFAEYRQNVPDNGLR